MSLECLRDVSDGADEEKTAKTSADLQEDVVEPSWTHWTELRDRFKLNWRGRAKKDHHCFKVPNL